MTKPFPPAQPLQQNTRVWRYFGRMRMLNKTFPKGPMTGLSNALWQQTRRRLERPGRSAPSAPPGAFRTPWGWHRIRAGWKR